MKLNELNFFKDKIVKQSENMIHKQCKKTL